MWQVQGKREKTITPARMRTLLREGVDQTKPPYGYILAAATNISKTTHDTFREELRKKGVIEFYFWGKDHLEDQLSLPQNDEILFTFFGLSLSPQRRSRTSELKFNINNKNKMLKLILGSEGLLGQQMPRNKAFLLRDVKADQYPYREAYPDFDEYRRWEEHKAVKVTARGVFFDAREWYAYLDQTKKEWDFSKSVDVTPRKHNIDRTNQARFEDEGKKAECFWRHLPRRLQARLLVFGFASFEDILIIDERGDTEFTDPHIFIDFGPHGPFQYLIGNLVQNQSTIHDSEFGELKRVQIFPSTFPEPKRGAVYDPEKLGLGDEEKRSLERLRGATRLFSFDSKLEALTEGSLIRTPRKDPGGLEEYAEVTHVYDITVGAFILEQGSEYYRTRLQSSAGRELADTDRMTVYEIYRVMGPPDRDYPIYLDDDRD